MKVDGLHSLNQKKRRGRAIKETLHTKKLTKLTELLFVLHKAILSPSPELFFCYQWNSRTQRLVEQLLHSLSSTWIGLSGYYVSWEKKLGNGHHTTIYNTGLSNPALWPLVAFLPLLACGPSIKYLRAQANWPCECRSSFVPLFEPWSRNYLPVIYQLDLSALMWRFLRAILRKAKRTEDVSFPQQGT